MTTQRRQQRWAEGDKKHLWHPFTQQAEWAQSDPLVIDNARGVFLRDLRGRTYIDGVSSLWVTAHGHRHPDLDRALLRQLAKVAHTTFLGLTHVPAVKLGEALVRVAPKGLTRVFYSDNGATAVEVALKMAFQYWNQSSAPAGRKRVEFMALENSYHGDTLGAVSVGGIAHFQKKFRPLLFRARFAPSPHCDRCPFRRRPSAPRLRTGDDPVLPRPPRPGDPRAETGCRWECLTGAEKILKNHGQRMAAAIVEPLVQAATGMWVMPPGYLQGLAALCRRYGVLLIADEVATGFGRTGRLFALEHEGVRPDFLCLAKSLTGGYLPLSATLTTEKIHQAFLGRYEEFKTFFHGHTYTANPLACAVAVENLALFKRERTLSRLAPRRRELTDFLRSLTGHPLVGHVRQMGFMAGIELRDTRRHQPFPVTWRVAARVCREAQARGLWTRPLGDTLVILPPLSISKAELGRLLAILRSALDEVSARLNTKGVGL